LESGRVKGLFVSRKQRDKEVLEGRDKEWHNSKAHALDTR